MAHSEQVLYVGSQLRSSHVRTPVHSHSVDQHEPNLFDIYGVPGILRDPITYLAHALVLPSVFE